MGVEYTHGIFVPDLSWRPTRPSLESIARVLQKWGFVRGDDALCDLATGDTVSLDESHPLPAFLEVLELRQERRAARDVVRRTQERHEVIGAPFLIAPPMQNLAHEQHADHGVGLAAADGHPRVITGLEFRAYLLARRIEVERIDLAARRHDVVDGDLLEIEEVDQHHVMLGRQIAAALEHERAPRFEGR